MKHEVAQPSLSSVILGNSKQLHYINQLSRNDN